MNLINQEKVKLIIYFHLHEKSKSEIVIIENSK
jgi:hypothetical protein